MGLAIEVRNFPDGEGELNKGVGADFVQKEQRAPEGFDPQELVGRRCASLDGDADRLVYFFFDSPDSSASSHERQCSPAPSTLRFRLLDGDKIATLAAHFVSTQLDALAATSASHHTSHSDVPTANPTTSSPVKLLFPSTSNPSPPGVHHKSQALVPGYGAVTVGVVQTAYANGASTAHIAGIAPGIEIVCTPTGVKHLHAAAHAFDIGIYFEANGHGTVLFGERFLAWLTDFVAKHVATRDSLPAEVSQGQVAAVQRLIALSGIMNQAVGDALSGILLVETVLRSQRWSMSDWMGLYEDLPSRQLKVKVADRSVISTTYAETQVVTPEGLQAAIDAEVDKRPRARAFVRPSGTEDVVRVYAEAEIQEEADALAHAVAAHVRTLAGGLDGATGEA
eukprot:TRINITY_DN29835_c0_g1_i1.p1 TRINITY_DN29835_c0_g1~~TRINITY_DN29835_c0_g1_i1.p1  ORF type:complete len:441 (+),score=64.53 TRINITY_DN29835_c0_g1_i1:141-1325(+)